MQSPDAAGWGRFGIRRFARSRRREYPPVPIAHKNKGALTPPGEMAMNAKHRLLLQALVFVAALSILFCPANANVSGKLFAQMQPVTPMEREVLTDGLKGIVVGSSDGRPRKFHEIRDSFLISVITSPGYRPIGNRLEIHDAIIVHDADYHQRRRALVQIDLDIEDSSFEATFDCSGCHFRGDITLFEDKFHRGINLDGSDIAGDLTLEGGSVGPLPDSLISNSMQMSDLRVGGKVSIFGTNFTETVDATHLKAASVFAFSRHLGELQLLRAELGSAVFELQDDSDKPSIELAGATIHDLYLRLPSIISTIDLSSIQANQVALGNEPALSHKQNLSHKPPDGKGEILLGSATIKGDLVVSNVDIESLLARHASIPGRLRFTDVTIRKIASLEDATLGSLEWSAEAFPQKLLLANITCAHWNISRPAGGSHDVTLEVLSNSEFSQAAFGSYEADLESRGATSRAEEVYFAMRAKRRQVNWQEGRWAAVILDWVQQYCLGYGRSAEAPLVWSAIFVLFGFLIFRKAIDMEPRVEKPAAYSGFWYSLELFLPIVDLGVAKEWRPKPTSGLRIFYARFHELVGWILVPVAIAAITGIAR